MKIKARAQDRLGELVHRVTDHPHELIVGVDDVEGDQPAQDHRGNHHPQIQVEGDADDLQERNEDGVHGTDGPDRETKGRGTLLAVFCPRK